MGTAQAVSGDQYLLGGLEFLMCPLDGSPACIGSHIRQQPRFKDLIDEVRVMRLKARTIIGLV